MATSAAFARFPPEGARRTLPRMEMPTCQPQRRLQAPTDAVGARRAVAAVAPDAWHGRSPHWPRRLALSPVLLLVAAAVACQQSPQAEPGDAPATSNATSDREVPATMPGLVPAPTTPTAPATQASPDAAGGTGPGTHAGSGAGSDVDQGNRAAPPAARPLPVDSGAPAPAAGVTGAGSGPGPVQVQASSAPASDGPLPATAFGAAASDDARAEPAIRVDPPARPEVAARARDATTTTPQPMAAGAGEPSGHDDQPPTTADAPEVREAWLARVRELLDAGDIAAGRASLAEFHRRHPQVELPADLRALLD